MRKPPIPSVIAVLFEAPVSRNGLIAGTLALVAAALDPNVFSPTLPTIQATIRERPSIESLVLLAAVGGAALLLVGGAVGDTVRARRVIVGGLAVELAAAVASMLVPSGPVFIVSRFVGHGAAAFIIPASLALVALSYRGIPRATAIGLAYGAYGGAAAVAPILLQLAPGLRAPAFIAVIVACIVALLLVRSRIPDLDRPTPPERPYVVRTAVWAFGLIALTVGFTWVGASWDDPLRIGLIIGGLGIVAVALIRDRLVSASGSTGVRIERRPAAIAVFIGVILGIAQTAPMMELPRYFQIVLRFNPLLAVVGLAPLFGALIVAGPAAGFLLARWSPRQLVGVGAITVGIGNLALAVVVTSSTGYLLFVVPCFLIGAGFVVATTVRTAIIFASVPRGLPATAAALNEASISVGARIGIVIVTAIVAEVATASYSASVGRLPTSEAEHAIEAFREVLFAVGTPSFTATAAAVATVDGSSYIQAYATGVSAALALSGIVVIIGGVVAWLGLGRQDPLATVYEHRDERVATAG